VIVKNLQILITRWSQ